MKKTVWMMTTIKLMEDKADGSGNIFPGEPSCCVGGKVVPPFVTFSPSGEITAIILTQYLRYIDK